jgi:hypothetical protein
MNESEKRDFCRRMIQILGDNSERITALGFDVASMVTTLGTLAEAADDKESNQVQAKEYSLNATAGSVSSTDEAYKKASGVAEIIIGLVGRNDALARAIRQIRPNNGGSSQNNAE